MSTRSWKELYHTPVQVSIYLTPLNIRKETGIQPLRFRACIKNRRQQKNIPLPARLIITGYYNGRWIPVQA